MIFDSFLVMIEMVINENGWFSFFFVFLLIIEELCGADGGMHQEYDPITAKCSRIRTNRDRNW